MQRALIVGGGVGGLMAALALGRSGHHVTVLERDVLAPLADAEEAFATERRGAPQVHQTHGFLARLQVTLRDRFPDVLEALLAAGGTTMPMTAALGEPRAGDDDLQVIIIRRSTLEWVLRQAAAREARVELRSGVGVTGLTASGTVEGLPRVDGVVLDDGSTLSADLVVAAAGRRGPVPQWLGALGVEVPEAVHESGLMYLTRWYRHRGSLGDLDPKLGGDLGFVKYLGVPGDGDTLSVTLAVRTSDGPLRAALGDPDRFDLACRLLPGPDQFFRHGAALVPLGGVRPMAGLLNRLRRFTGDDGRPTVAGFAAVGDCHTTTNPLYGRGCALAAVQAVLLADALAAHPDDPVAAVAAYEAANREEIEPWFDSAVQMDRMGSDPGGPGSLGASAAGRDGPSSDAAKGLAAVFAAARTDPVIGRGIVRFMNLLATPAQLMADAELVGRIAEVMADPDSFPVPPREGPSRRALLEQLGATDGAVAPPIEEVPA